MDRFLHLEKKELNKRFNAQKKRDIATAILNAQTKLGKLNSRLGITTLIDYNQDLPSKYLLFYLLDYIQQITYLEKMVE